MAWERTVILYRSIRTFQRLKCYKWELAVRLSYQTFKFSSADGISRGKIDQATQYQMARWHMLKSCFMKFFFYFPLPFLQGIFCHSKQSLIIRLQTTFVTWKSKLVHCLNKSFWEFRAYMCTESRINVYLSSSHSRYDSLAFKMFGIILFYLFSWILCYHTNSWRPQKTVWCIETH